MSERNTSHTYGMDPKDFRPPNAVAELKYLHEYLNSSFEYAAEQSIASSSRGIRLPQSAIACLCRDVLSSLRHSMPQADIACWDYNAFYACVNVGRPDPINPYLLKDDLPQRPQYWAFDRDGEFTPDICECAGWSADTIYCGALIAPIIAGGELGVVYVMIVRRSDQSAHLLLQAYAQNDTDTIKSFLPRFVVAPPVLVGQPTFPFAQKYVLGRRRIGFTGHPDRPYIMPNGLVREFWL